MQRLGNFIRYEGGETKPFNHVRNSGENSELGMVGDPVSHPGKKEAAGKKKHGSKNKKNKRGKPTRGVGRGHGKRGGH